MRVSCALLASFVILAAFARAAHAAQGVSVGPRPNWVAVAPDAREGAAPPPPGALGDVYDEISDEQVHVGQIGGRKSGCGSARYFRTRRHIVASSGVVRASEIGFSFDPSYERVVFHAIRVIRDGVARDELDLESIRVFSEESEADERIYDGSMTALAIVPDVRPGDIIDSEATIEGDNPVFEGHFADSLRLGSRVWTGWLRARVLLPVEREASAKVSSSTLSVSTRVLGSEREYTIERENVAAAKNEDDAPSWFSAVPVLRVSEYRDWGDVAQWAASLFRSVGAADAKLAAKVAELRSANATPEARALAAIRFVQDEVRYLGIEMGEYSHKPHTPGSVLRQRFGDCKDKSMLLVSLLRALDFEADVALVNTRLAAHVDELLPSHYAFNHAIVHARVQGREVWVDATSSLEGGGLARYSTLPHGRALVVAAATRELATLPAPKLEAPELVTHEVYTAIDGNAEDATLDVTTTSRGDEADSVRAHFARKPREEIATRYLNYYAQLEPSVRPVGEVGMSDDRASNVVVVTEHYVIPGFFREGLARVHGGTLHAPLASPRTSLRTMPLEVLYPYWARHEIELRLHAAPKNTPESNANATNALSFERKVHVDGRVVGVDFEVRTRADSVRAEDVAKHLRNLEDMRDELDLAIELGSAKAPFKWKIVGLSVGGVTSATGVFFAFIYLPGWWRRRTWRKRQVFGRGDTAKTAQAAESRAEAERDVLSHRCTCGGRLEGPLPESAWSSIQLGDATVTAVRVPCACGEDVRRYYLLPDADRPKLAI